MIARNKVHELMQKHHGDIKACFVTATEVYSELEKMELKVIFGIKQLKN